MDAETKIIEKHSTEVRPDGFRSYGKIHHLGKEETDGILLGTCYIEEKIDGANTSIWMDAEGNIKCGSRTRILGEEEFNGFVPFVKSTPKIWEFLNAFPKYRLYGEWLCLSGDTVIKKVAGGKGAKGNFMTLREMYQYANQRSSDRNTSWWARYGMPSIYSLKTSTDRVLPNKIKKIEFTGNKEVWELTTREGFKIKSTKEHKILTQLGYIPLADLDIKLHVVAVTDLRSERTNIRNLGVGSRKILREQKKFISSKGKCRNCENTTSLELDHVDEDWANNDPCNWQVLCSQCHRSKSGFAQQRKKPHSKGYSYRFDQIKTIILKGVEDTYDIEMDGDESQANFVANNFIVHNCRHTIAYKETAYKKWYMFDIWNGDDHKYLPFEKVKEIADAWGLSTVPFIEKIENPSVEYLQTLAGKSVLGDRGEGIVIKNLDFVNKFGDVNFAKLVTESFKEDNAVTFGGNNKHSDTYYEVYVVNKYMTLARVQKVMNKIQPEINEKLDMKHIPRIMGTCFHDMMVEEIWQITKDVSVLNFKVLKRIADKKCKQIFVDIINDSISVADRKN